MIKNLIKLREYLEKTMSINHYDMITLDNYIDAIEHEIYTHDQNQIETFEENFYWSVAWYNGYEEEFDKVLNYLKEKQKTIKENELYFGIPRPDFITSEDSIMELYWMQLVQAFGEYGTSPRSGWIARDRLNDCINHITEMINKTYCEGR